MSGNNTTRKERIIKLTEKALDAATDLMSRGIFMTDEDRENVDTYLTLADGLRKLMKEEMENEKPAVV